MKKVFMEKDVTNPEEYLKNMLDCIDENGELSIARDIDDMIFCTAESEETTTYIEKLKLDVALADYDSIYNFYCDALGDINAFILKYSSECETNPFCDRMVTFARRIDLLIEWKVVYEDILRNEKRLFIDSVLLYKTHAVGELIEN